MEKVHKRKRPVPPVIPALLDEKVCRNLMKLVWPTVHAVPKLNGHLERSLDSTTSCHK